MIINVEGVKLLQRRTDLPHVSENKPVKSRNWSITQILKQPKRWSERSQHSKKTMKHITKLAKFPRLIKLVPLGENITQMANL